MSDSKPKESWSSRFGVILAVTGSAVGLGNFLRFPGLAASNGGGAFMIPYFVSFLLIGVPIAWVEWAMGRYGGARGYHSSPGVFRAVMGHRLGTYLGLLGPVIPVVIYVYYIFIEAWCLGYAWKYLTGSMSLDPSTDFGAHFAAFTGSSAHGSVLTGVEPTLILVALCYVLNFALVYVGISKGIETFCRYAMPALAVCAVVVLVRVLTLGTPDPAHPDWNVGNGLGAMWNLSGNGRSLVDTLSNPEVWLAAAGQIFFSLSVGFGIVLTYASYMKPDDDVMMSSLTAAAGNEFFEVALGGLITIPAAFIFLGPGILEDVPGTFGMGFVALPSVFAHMPGGQLFGFLFFFLLFIAAITSSISMLQPAIALFEEGLSLGRKEATILLSFVTLSGTSLVVYFSKDFAALDTLDFWIGSLAIFVLATIQVIVFGWFFGVKRGLAELDRGAIVPIPRFVGVLIKYVSPAYLLVIFALWLVRNLPERLAQLGRVPPGEPPVVAIAMGFIGVVVAFFAMVLARANRHWDAREGQRAESLERDAALEGTPR